MGQRPVAKGPERNPLSERRWVEAEPKPNLQPIFPKERRLKMKKTHRIYQIGVVLILAALLLSGCDVIEFILSEDSSSTGSRPSPSAIPPEPSGEFINDPWVDYDVRHNDVNGHERKGMLIHTRAKVHNLRNTECVLVVRFEFASGNRLEDFNGEYRIGSGPGTYIRFVPQYEHSDYDDMRLFMPYDELHLASGSHDLRFYLELADNSSGDKLAKSAYHYFSITAP